MARRGRKRDINAKRRKTTAAERNPIDRGSDELRAKRVLLTGDEMTNTEFPLDVMLARGLISRRMRNEGMRFAALAWSLFGRPEASCAALYERMIAETFGEGYAPRMENETPADEAKRKEEDRKAHRAILRALQGPGEARTILNAVQNAAQYSRFPRGLLSLIEGLSIRPSDRREMEALEEGLRRLVRAADAEMKQAA